MLTWADEAIRMFTDRAFGSLTAQDVHVLIDWIDERPEEVRKLEEIDRKLLRQELLLLVLPLRETHRATPPPFGSFKSRTLPTR